MQTGQNCSQKKLSALSLSRECDIANSSNTHCGGSYSSGCRVGYEMQSFQIKTRSEQI
jgi:hypothetical protein